MFALRRTVPNVPFQTAAVSSSLLAGEVSIPPAGGFCRDKKSPSHSLCLRDEWLIGGPDVVEPMSRVVEQPVGTVQTLFPLDG